MGMAGGVAAQVSSGCCMLPGRRLHAAGEARPGTRIQGCFAAAPAAALPQETNVFISNAYAQAAPAAASPESGLLGMLPLVLMFVVLYFVMIRPQMKRQKEHKAMIEAIAKGDEVVTAGGIVGKVSKLGDNFIHLEVANGVELQLQRSAITQVLPKGSVKAA
jgi:preprotein translocase subunit YajC